MQAGGWPGRGALAVESTTRATPSNRRQSLIRVATPGDIAATTTFSYRQQLIFRNCQLQQRARCGCIDAKQTANIPIRDRSSSSCVGHDCGNLFVGFASDGRSGGRLAQCVAGTATFADLAEQASRDEIGEHVSARRCVE